MSKFLIVFVLLAIVMVQVQSTYFLVGAERKCFTIEQPRDTPVLFGYSILDPGHEIIFDLFYGELALDELRIVNKVLKESTGHIDFVADNDGYYSYCVQQPTDSNELPSRLELSVKYGYDGDHYEKLIKEHNFDTVNLQVHKLNDVLTMTLNEADYQKHKEVSYHDQTEKMNNAALWWPVLQIGILVVTGVYQVQHLKNFFKSNKLI